MKRAILSKMLVLGLLATTLMGPAAADEEPAHEPSGTDCEDPETCEDLPIWPLEVEVHIGIDLKDCTGRKDHHILVDIRMGNPWVKARLDLWKGGYMVGDGSRLELEP